MRIGLLAFCLLIVVGCSLAKVGVAHGTLSEGGTWSAFVYEGGGDLGVCLELQATDREPDKLCGLRADNAGSWQPDGPAGGERFVVVTTPDQTAFAARVALAGQAGAQASFGAALSLTKLRFFVMALPPGQAPSEVEILDGNGAVLAKLPLQ